MSQEIALHQMRNLPAGAEDLWGRSTNPGTQLGAYQPQHAQPQPLKKITRLLRGRWLLALCLAAAGAMVGAVIGWKLDVALYAGQGIVEVRPTVPNFKVMDSAIPYFLQILKAQSLFITSDRVISQALQDPEWLKAGGHKGSPEYVAAVQTNLTAVWAKDTNVIQVAFLNENPKLAAAGCNAVMNAYVYIRKNDGSDAQQGKLEAAMELRRRETDLKEKDQQQIAELTKDAGTPDLGPRLSQMQERLDKLQFDTDLEELQLKNAMAVVPDAKGNRNVAPLTPEEIAQVDPHMRALLDQKHEKNEKYEAAKAYYGPNHPLVAKAGTDLALADQAVKDYATEANGRVWDLQPGSSPQNSTGVVPVTPRTIQTEKTRIANFHAEIAKLAEDITAKNNIFQKVQVCTEEVRHLTESIGEHDKLIEQMQVSSSMQGSVNVMGRAIEPLTPAVDKRKQLALAGFVVGGGLPVGLLLLIGLLDSRYRYSDDANDTGVHGLTLLGILPNLPDRLSDPGQASIAAHCVHQIRTMLQLNSQEDRRAFSLTSASSGDGKTSLTLALGLSFAASGSRTLLIDSDLVGAGLTARLGMNGPEGILEAMTSGNLLDYTKTTDVADLCILPVGLAQLHHAGIFSPQAVRRLVNEAKKHFEIILIDTGPILGSIEATPVAAASDGVILTVSRGQQRPLVEKALAHLNSIGARIAGVVFNRAQARDFEQSISGISMRSASRSANGNNGHSRTSQQQKDVGQYGPVARAVATSVKAPDGNNKN